MSEREHFVVVFLNEEKGQFSITARKRDARLDELKGRAQQKGFAPKKLAENLSKNEAEIRKGAERAKYEAQGYVYKTVTSCHS